MKYTKTGNEKLGKKVNILNRPVGTTCPASCWFLNNGCYAQFTERRFPNSRSLAENNLIVKKEDIKEILEDTVKHDKILRIHERGDFKKEGKIDGKYLKAWKLALKTIKKLPHIWTYTHVLSKQISDLQNFGVNVYASVHSEQEYHKAKDKGFKLFAWVLKDKKKKGGSKDYPKFVDLPVLGRTLVCPEHRRGRQQVTCEKCKWCSEGKGNVVFLTH
jgi:hypothetical protein